jgi:hypothetical protein
MEDLEGVDHLIQEEEARVVDHAVAIAPVQEREAQERIDLGLACRTARDGRTSMSPRLGPHGHVVVDDVPKEEGEDTRDESGAP